MGGPGHVFACLCGQRDTLGTGRVRDAPQPREGRDLLPVHLEAIVVGRAAVEVEAGDVTGVDRRPGVHDQRPTLETELVA